MGSRGQCACITNGPPRSWRYDSPMQRLPLRSWRRRLTLRVTLIVPFAVMGCGGDSTSVAGVDWTAPTDGVEIPLPPERDVSGPLPVDESDETPPLVPALECVGDEPWCEADASAPCTLRCEPRSNGCIAFSEFVPLGVAPDSSFYFRIDALGADGQYVYLSHEYSGGSLRTFPYRWTPAEGLVSLAAAWGVAGTEFGRTADGRELYGAILDVSQDGDAVIGMILDDEVSEATGGVVSVASEPSVQLDFLPLAMSNDGRVVVGVRDGRAMIWDTAGGTRQLADEVTGWSQHAVVLSDSGAAAIVNGLEGETLYWSRSGGVVRLVDLLGLSADTSLSARVSDDGEVVYGSASDSATGHSAAFRWTESRGVQWLEALPFVDAAARYRVLHATSDGRVLIGSVTLQDDTSAGFFSWSEEAGTKQIILADKDATPTYFSSRGDTIIGAYSGSPFRWNAVTGLSDVIHSDAGRVHVALDGDLIVVEETPDAPRALKFGRALESAQRLPIEIILSDLVPTGWQAAQIAKVSANGIAVAGAGSDPSGQRQGWLVRVKERCQ